MFSSGMEELDRLKEMAILLEEKLALVAELTGRKDLKAPPNEPSLHAENRFLRSELEMLRSRLKASEHLIEKQSEMVSMIACMSPF